MTFGEFAMLTEALASLALAAGAVFWAIVTLKTRGTHQIWTLSFENMNGAFDNMNDAFRGMMEAFTAQRESLEDVVGWTVPAEEWKDVVELYQQIATYNGQGRLSYLIYCHQNGGYWKMNDHGYTKQMSDAKRFTAAEGLILVLDRSRNGIPDDCYTLVAVAKEG